MPQTIQVLRKLQEVDVDLHRLRAELSRLPREREQAERQLAAMRQRHAGLMEQVRELRARIKEIEDDTTQARQRMRKVESEALKSRGDVALQAAFQHQARALKREISSSEEEGLRMLEDVEALEARAGELEGEIDAEAERVSALSQNIEHEIEEARARAAELEEERSRRMNSELDPEVLSKYEKLLDVRHGQALAVLDGRICQGCYMEVPPNLHVRVARGLELVQCPNCGRFLYFTE